MKTVNKILFFHGKGFLSIVVLTITLVGIISSSIITDYAVQAYNTQATDNSLIDLSFFGDYEIYQNFTPEAFEFETTLPINSVFVTQKSFTGSCFLSKDDSLTVKPEIYDVQSIYILSINLSSFQTYPFSETVKNPHYLNNSEGIYITRSLQLENNLVIGENFSYYDIPSYSPHIVEKSIHNITLINELILEDEIWFSQMFGFHTEWELISGGSYGIMLMDSYYYEEKFLPQFNPKSVLNYVFDKTGVLNMKPSTINEIFTTIIGDIDSKAGAIGYDFTRYESPFLLNIEYYTNSFKRFRYFLILGSFPIFLFAWWVNKTSISWSLKSQLSTLGILQSKGVSKSTLRKKIFVKSIIIGVLSWILAVLLSQFLSLGLRYYLFEYEWTFFFSFNRLLNTSTLLLLPIGMGISFLSTLSALFTIFRKDTDIIESESEQNEPRLLRKQSKRRAILMGVVSLLPLFVYLFPAFGIDVIVWWQNQNEGFLIQMANLLGILALIAPFFFIIAVIDIISLSTPMKRKTNKMKTQGYLRRLAVQRITRNIRKYAQFVFILSISITLISQSITYNKIVEINDYHTDLATDGNGFALRYDVLNESYTHFQQITHDIRNNQQIKSLIHDDISLVKTNDIQYLDMYDLWMINTSEWEKNIDLPRNWVSLSSDQIYSQLVNDGSILVSDRFLEEENFDIGDTFTFSYYNITGQQVEKELNIIGSFYRFPLLGLQTLPGRNSVFITDISFFQDVNISSIQWTFFPKDENINYYELYKVIQAQIYKSDSTGGSIELDGLSTDKLEFPEPPFPYSKFLQIEAISLALIILIGLIILLKQQFESASVSRSQFRKKGMSKKSLRKMYFSELLSMLFLSFLIFIPAYTISLQSIFALNLTISYMVRYVISVPIIGILLLLGAFLVVLSISYNLIVRSGMKETKQKKYNKLTIS